MFQPRRFIEAGMADIHRRIVAAGHFRGIGPGGFAEGAGTVLGDINHVNPFREGNGRTQLQYLKQLAARAGHALDLTWIDRAAWLDASRRSNAGDHTAMTRCVRRALRQPIRPPSAVSLCASCADRLVMAMAASFPVCGKACEPAMTLQEPFTIRPNGPPQWCRHASADRSRTDPTSKPSPDVASPGCLLPGSRPKPDREASAPAESLNLRGKGLGRSRRLIRTGELLRSGSGCHARLVAQPGGRRCWSAMKCVNCPGNP